MHITHTIRTSYGRSRTTRPGMVRLTLSRSEVHAIVLWLERQAEEADTDGHSAASELLWNRVATLREAVR